MSIAKYITKLEDLAKLVTGAGAPDEEALLDELEVLRRGPRETVLAMATCFEDVVEGPEDISSYRNSLTGVALKATRIGDTVTIVTTLPKKGGE